MATEIEKLWEDGRNDVTEQTVNGTLLSQSTFICPACGHEKVSSEKCIICSHEVKPDASHR